jgi:hypothetical protein
MSPDQSQGIVVGCLAATAAIVAGNQVVAGEAPEFRQLVGGAFVAVGLASVALVAPDLAAGFSVLILTSAVFVYGAPLFDTLAAPSPSSFPRSSPGRQVDPSPVSLSA